MVGDNAHLRCKTGGHGHDYHVKDWSFSCHHHTEFKPLNTMAWFASVSRMGASLAESGLDVDSAAQWLQRCIQNTVSK
jgi:hypothetical protein